MLPGDTLYLREEFFKEDIDQVSISQQPIDKIWA